MKPRPALRRCAGERLRQEPAAQQAPKGARSVVASRLPAEVFLLGVDSFRVEAAFLGRAAGPRWAAFLGGDRDVGEQFAQLLQAIVDVASLVAIALADDQQSPSAVSRAL